MAVESNEKEINKIMIRGREVISVYFGEFLVFLMGYLFTADGDALFTADGDALSCADDNSD